MTRVRSIATLGLFFLAACLSVTAQTEDRCEIASEHGEVQIDPNTGFATATNGVVIRYKGVVLTADSAAVNQQSGEILADGRVSIQQLDQTWTGNHIRYNYKTHQMEALEFHTG